jgi:hypothetical protein
LKEKAVSQNSGTPLSVLVQFGSLQDQSQQERLGQSVSFLTVETNV